MIGLVHTTRQKISLTDVMITVFHLSTLIMCTCISISTYLQRQRASFDMKGAWQKVMRFWKPFVTPSSNIANGKRLQKHCERVKRQCSHTCRRLRSVIKTVLILFGLAILGTLDIRSQMRSKARTQRLKNGYRLPDLSHTSFPSIIFIILAIY